MASFLRKAAVYAAALLGTATAVQAQGIHTPMPPEHTHSSYYPPAQTAAPAPRPMTAQQKCRALSAEHKPQTIYPKIGKAYLEAQGFACELTRSPSGQYWNVSDTYNTETKPGVDKLSRDNQAAARDEARTIKNEARQDESRRNREDYRSRRESRNRSEARPVADTAPIIGNPGTRRPLPERRDLPETVAKPEGQRRHNADIATPAAP